MSRIFWPVVSAAVLVAAARAENLILNPGTPLDISALNVGSIGDLALERAANKLWISDGAANGLVFQVNPITGALLSSFDPAVVPGLGNGPDALSVLPASFHPHLAVFSSFGESEGGRIDHFGGFVSEYPGSNAATGADVDNAGNLWIASGTALGGGSVLRRIDATSGVVLASVPILANTARVVDLAFDPHSGACYCLLEGSNDLVEIDTTSGAQLSHTDLTPYLIVSGTIAGGIAFLSAGARLAVATGNGAGADTVVVLNRTFSHVECDGTDPLAPCPCGNAGLPGRGCENSFATGGARLTELGQPSVVFDSYVLRVAGMPPSASCLFFQGTTPPESNPVALGDGLQCVSGSVIRLATKTAVNGLASFPENGDPALHVRGQIPAAGGTRYYQVWYRNAAAFCTSGTFNFSNGIRVTWAP